MTPATDLSSRYQEITRRMRAAAGTREVTLIAVSKTQPASAIEALYRLGHRDFGENYVQELVEKAAQLAVAGCTDIRWHFIGHLQTNKAKALAPLAHAVHSVDSEKLARELAKRWAQARGNDASPLPVFIEVNIDREESKSGIAPEAVPTLAAAIASMKALRLQGLMAVPAAQATPERTTASFAALRDLELRCRPHSAGLLSMGMSDDFELAIPQGATHIRVGTALFGKRYPVPF